MANTRIHVKVTKTFVYNSTVVVPNTELTVDAIVADNLVERNLVIVVGEELGDENTDGHTDELDGMTVEELREYASEAGINLKGISKKADIIAAIREAE